MKFEITHNGRRPGPGGQDHLIKKKIAASRFHLGHARAGRFKAQHFRLGVNGNAFAFGQPRQAAHETVGGEVRVVRRVEAAQHFEAGGGFHGAHFIAAQQFCVHAVGSQ